MDDLGQSLAEYYARRAAEYEEVYRKPERQGDLRTIADLLSTAFAGRDVLEIACGTGYWTQFIAKSARSILATDYSAEALDVARRKDYGACRVAFLESDAYSLSNVRGEWSAGFHGFWWSHVPIEKTAAFLAVFHGRLLAGASVIMIDNRYVEGSSTPISRRDEHGNTYQARKLRDGSEHEVLKNFPTAGELRERLSACADAVAVEELEYYWIVRYKTKEPPLTPTLSP
jgi:SAM-dependent methyltransferase